MLSIKHFTKQLIEQCGLVNGGPVNVMFAHIVALRFSSTTSSLARFYLAYDTLEIAQVRSVRPPALRQPPGIRHGNQSPWPVC